MRRAVIVGSSSSEIVGWRLLRDRVSEGQAAVEQAQAAVEQAQAAVQQAQA